MGDMGELFRAWNEHKQKAKFRNLSNAKAALDVFQEMPYFTMHTEYHWSLWLDKDDPTTRVDYWPSTNKWRYRNRNTQGNVQSFMGWISNRMRELDRAKAT